MFDDQVQGTQQNPTQENPPQKDIPQGIPQARGTKPKIDLPKADPYYYQPGELAEEVMGEGGGNKKLIIIGIAILILAGLSIGGYFLYNNFFGAEEEVAVVNITNNSNLNTNNSVNKSNDNGSLIVPGSSETWIGDLENSYGFEAPPSSAEEAMAVCKQKEDVEDEYGSCYAHAAWGFGNPLFCEWYEFKPDAIQLEKERAENAISTCMFGFFNRFGRIECSIYKNSEYSDICYLLSASDYTNSTLDCTMIIDDEKKNECEFFVSTIEMVYEMAKTTCFLQDNSEAIKYFPEGKIRNGYIEILTNIEEFKEFQKTSEWLNLPASEKTLQIMGMSVYLDCGRYENDDIKAIGELVLKDEDDDGLNAYLEGRYLTDDSNEDTDGDGYDDLTEINNGYNPNGSGKMEYL